MVNIIKKVTLSFNVYSYYFIKSFWLNDGDYSEEYKVGSGLTILLIMNFSWIYFIFNQIEFNWKAAVFFVGCYHLFVQIFFHKEISNIVNNKKSKEFEKWYLVFIFYLIIGCVFLFLNVFYY